MSKGLPIFILMVILLAGCSSNVKVTQKKIKLIVIESKEFDLGSSSDNRTAGELNSIPFNRIKTTLTKKANQLLKKNLEILKSNSDLTVQLEGHCYTKKDRKYNYKLGLKRAKKVKGYLTRNGIDSSRISLISFGSEKPIVINNKKKNYKNRRVNFVISYQ